MTDHDPEVAPPPHDAGLEAAACAVREQAHAPYSGFAVGAAIRGAAGGVHVGCNVENAAYPESTCAEAAAVCAMVAAGERHIAAVFVIADHPDPVPPCGGCRQRLAEFAGPEVPVTMANLRGARRTLRLGALLPAAFARATPAGG